MRCELRMRGVRCEVGGARCEACGANDLKLLSSRAVCPRDEDKSQLCLRGVSQQMLQLWHNHTLTVYEVFVQICNDHV